VDDNDESTGPSDWLEGPQLAIAHANGTKQTTTRDLAEVMESAGEAIEATCAPGDYCRS